MKKFDKQKIMEAVTSTIIVAIMIAAVAGGLFYATSAECWYAGEHDSHCEGFDEEEGISCGCYERLVAADKKIETERSKKK